MDSCGFGCSWLSLVACRAAVDGLGPVARFIAARARQCVLRLGHIRPRLQFALSVSSIAHQRES
jgi:hypothetical protein